MNKNDLTLCISFREIRLILYKIKDITVYISFKCRVFSARCVNPELEWGESEFFREIVAYAQGNKGDNTLHFVPRNSAHLIQNKRHNRMHFVSTQTAGTALPAGSITDSRLAVETPRRSRADGADCTVPLAVPSARQGFPRDRGRGHAGPKRGVSACLRATAPATPASAAVWLARTALCRAPTPTG